jgi:hypothetical protein
MERTIQGRGYCSHSSAKCYGAEVRSSCAVKFSKDGREAVEHLKLDLDYDTPTQAERAGLVFSKIWIDAGKPQPLAGLNE